MTPREPETLERIQAKARAGAPGSKRAQEQVRLATLRGLAAATGRPLPKGVA